MPKVREHTSYVDTSTMSDDGRVCVTRAANGAIESLPSSKKALTALTMAQ